MILPKQLRQELEEKRNTLVHLIHNERHQLAPKDRAIIKKYNQIKTMQEKEARVHAARGEVPVSELHYRPHAVDKSRFRKVLSGIEGAWDFGLLAYNGEPNEDFLKKLAWEIDPEFFGGDTAYFRRPGTMTTVQGWGYVPPSPEQDLENQFYEYVTHNREIDALSIPEQAFMFNFHITRIQPFPDCNKRTGKLTQNLHLNFYHYPPASVLEGESGYYYRHMIQAIRAFDRREGQGNYSPEERDFYEFLGTKVNNNLNAILDRSRYLPHQMRETEQVDDNGRSDRKITRKEVLQVRRPLHTFKSNSRR